MRQFRFFLVENRSRFEEALFTRARGAKLLRHLDVLATILQFLVIREFPDLVEEGHGLAPVSHGAFWVALRAVGEHLFGLLVLEGVEERDAFFDCGLHVCHAARGEIHFAELVGRRDGHRVCPQSCGTNRENHENKEEQPESWGDPSWMAHDPSSCWLQRFYSRQLPFAEINLLAMERRGCWTPLWRGGYNGRGAVLRSK